MLRYSAWISEIRSYQDRYGSYTGEVKELVCKRIKGSKVSVSGGRDLKNSQAYPSGFGEAMRDIYLRHKADLEADALANERDASKVHVLLDDVRVKVLVDKEQWADAELAGVFQYLLQCVNST